MNIMQQLLSYFNIDLDEEIDKVIRNVQDRLIKIKKLKNKRRNRKGAK